MKTKVFFLLTFYLLALNLNGQIPPVYNGQIHYSVSSKGSVAELIKSYLPKSFDIFIRKQNVRIQLNSTIPAEIPDEILFVAKKKKFFQLSSTTQTASLLSLPKQLSRKFNPSGESKVITGHLCEAYNASWEENGVHVAQEIWVAPISIPQGIKSFQLPIIENFGHFDLPGLPLLIETTLTRGDLTQIIRVKAITMDGNVREKTFFKIPKAYRVVK